MKIRKAEKEEKRKEVRNKYNYRKQQEGRFKINYIGNLFKYKLSDHTSQNT